MSKKELHFSHYYMEVNKKKDCALEPKQYTK